MQCKHDFKYREQWVRALVLTLVICLLHSAGLAQGVVISKVSLNGLRIGDSRRDVFQFLGWQEGDTVSAVSATKDNFEMTFDCDRLVEIQGDNLVMPEIGQIKRGDHYSKVERLLGQSATSRLKIEESVFTWYERGLELIIAFNPRTSQVSRIKVKELP